MVYSVPPTRYTNSCSSTQEIARYYCQKHNHRSIPTTPIRTPAAPSPRNQAQAGGGTVEQFRQLRYELLHQLRYELLHQLRYELLHQLRYKLLHQLRYELLHQLRYELLHQLRYELLHQLRYKLLHQLRYELLHQLRYELLQLHTGNCQEAEVQAAAGGAGSGREHAGQADHTAVRHRWRTRSPFSLRMKYVRSLWPTSTGCMARPSGGTPTWSEVPPLRADLLSAHHRGGGLLAAVQHVVPAQGQGHQFCDHIVWLGHEWSSTT